LQLLLEEASGSQLPIAMIGLDVDVSFRLLSLQHAEQEEQEAQWNFVEVVGEVAKWRWW